MTGCDAQVGWEVMTPQQRANFFVETRVRPVLYRMGMHSEAAEKLMLMIACHESQGFRHIRQVKGPALSYFQIEPNTLMDLYGSYLRKHGRRFLGIIRQFENPGIPLEQNLVEPDQRFACAAARLILWRVPNALPNVEDEVGLAHYAKEHWNTKAGAATAQKYLTDYLRYKPENY